MGKTLNSADVIAALEAAGWVLKAHDGSHWTYKKPGNPLIVTVPHPKKALPIGTLKQIERKAGIRLR